MYNWGCDDVWNQERILYGRPEIKFGEWTHERYSSRCMEEQPNIFEQNQSNKYKVNQFNTLSGSYLNHSEERHFKQIEENRSKQVEQSQSTHKEQNQIKQIEQSPIEQIEQTPLKQKEQTSTQQKSNQQRNKTHQTQPTQLKQSNHHTLKSNRALNGFDERPNSLNQNKGFCNSIQGRQSPFSDSSNFTWSDYESQISEEADASFEYGRHVEDTRFHSKPLREKNAKKMVKYIHVPHREKPPQVVAKRNARERRRVQAVNGAFLRLRKAVPIENNR